MKINTPRVKSAKSLSETCIDFILEIQDRFVYGIPTSKQDNGVVQALESEKSVINPFDGLHKYLYKMKKAKCFTKCLISYILASNLLDEIF